MRPSIWRTSALLLVILLSGVTAGAQGKRPFEDLGRYLHEGDKVFVVERAEGASEGVVVRISPAEIVVNSGSGQERRITKDSVGWIEKSPDSIVDGVLVGALFGGVIGLPAAAFGDPAAFLLITAMGAGVGAGLDALEQGRQVVYGRIPRVPFIHTPAPVSSLGDLWSRFKPGDRIRIEDSRGEMTDARFVKASAEALTIDSAGAQVVLPVDRVQRVQIRVFTGMSLWIGMGVGALGGALVDHDEYNPHSTREDIGKGLLLGGLLGLAASPLTTRYADIYSSTPAATARIRIAPMVRFGRRGVSLNVLF